MGEGTRTRVWRDPLVLAGCLFLAYGSSLVGSLVADDLILLGNAREATWSIGDLSRAFHIGCEDITDGWVSPRMEQYRLSFFRPVCVASLKADYALWGHWAPGYHLTNLLLQLAVVLLVYAWGRDFGFDLRARFLMALLFILYVPNMLSVGWVSGRTELISAALVLTSVMCLGRFHSNRSPGLFALSFAAYVLAMGTKENAVIIPFLHVLAAAFLYRSDGKARGELKRRALAVLPFFALLPVYFGLRWWALGGFPLPPKSFYYHPVTDPDFVRFALTKVSHTVLALVYQLPSVILPVFLERSLPVLAVMIAAAVATMAALFRWVEGPLRYFALGWVVLALAPTLPVGLNPVYYYLCSPVMAALYVLLYRRFSESHGARAGAMLKWAVALGFVLCAASGPIIRFGGEMNRRVGRGVMEILEANPDVERVYLLDISGGSLYVVPQVRLANSDYEDVEFHVLGMSSSFLGRTSSEVSQVDAFTFECRPDSGTYFSTGLEQVFFAQDILEFRTGAKVGQGDYEIEVAGVAPNFELREERPILKLLRDHFGLPGKGQWGVTALRYRFDRPLGSDDAVFVQVVGSQVRQIVFEGPMGSAEPVQRLARNGGSR